MKLLILSYLCLGLAGSAFSQNKTTPTPKPGRSIAPTPVSSSASAPMKDSVEFTKVFKEFYPFVAPAKPALIEAHEYFARISKTFKMQGIDSAKAAEVAFTNLDTNAHYKTYYDVYSHNLTTKELKKYLEFLKTPEGKKVMAVLPQLQRASSDATNYVSRTVNTNLTPIRQEARQKMMKENPPTLGGQVPQRDSTGRIIPPKRPLMPKMTPAPVDSTQTH
jgi:hypothetical protein